MEGPGRGSEHGGGSSFPRSVGTVGWRGQTDRKDPTVKLGDPWCGNRNEAQEGKNVGGINQSACWCLVGKLTALLSCRKPGC